MKQHILIAALLCLTLFSIPTYSQNLLHGPETVVYDPIGDRYFVSNMNSPSYIVEIDHDGSYNIFSNMTTWAHGMAIADNVLYVATNSLNRGGILGFDLSTGDVVFEELSTDWYNRTNGIAADTAGHLYVAIMNSSIYRVTPATGEVLWVTSSIDMVNGPYFDIDNNRLLVPGEIWDSYIYGIDADDFTMDFISISYGKYACITEDQMHNFYISDFFNNKVFRFDNAFSNEGELIATGQGTEGICFDKTHSTLVIPNLLADSLTFLPMDLDLWCTTGSTLGWSPVSVTFAGNSIYSIAEWRWDFGDGIQKSGPAPSHTYETPGLYDVKMQAITIEGDTLTRIFPRHIFCLADTLWVENKECHADGTLEVAVHMSNSVPVREMVIPIAYSGDLQLTYDSFSTAGCRSEAYGIKEIIDFDQDAHRVSFRFKPRNGSPLYESAGSGLVVKLYFHTNDIVPGQQAEFDLSGYAPEFMPKCSANGQEYAPATISGIVSCPYYCGDANTDVNINVGDAVFLINYIFKGGPGPEPVEAGGVNCDGQVNVADAVYLINYVFKGGPPPCCA